MASLPQQRNTLKVTGKLKSVFLEEKDLRSGMNAITGSIIVSYKENDKIQNHRVNVFAPAKSKAGKDMPSYASIKKLKNEFKDVDTYGQEDADRINVTGSVDYNVFTNRQGEVQKNLQLSGDFFSRVKPEDQDTVDGAKAEVDLTITGYKDEIKNDVPTGNTIVKNINVGYNDTIDTIPDLKFDSDLADSIDDIKNAFPIGSTASLQIKFNNYSDTTETTGEAHGFGKKAQIATATKFVNENLIFFVSTDPVKKGKLDDSQVQQARKLLKERLQPDEQNPQPQRSSFGNNGFGKSQPSQGFNKPKQGVIADDDDDDIPF